MLLARDVCAAPAVCVRLMLPSPLRWPERGIHHAGRAGRAAPGAGGELAGPRGALGGQGCPPAPYRRSSHRKSTWVQQPLGSRPDALGARRALSRPSSAACPGPQCGAGMPAHPQGTHLCECRSEQPTRTDSCPGAREPPAHQGGGPSWQWPGAGGAEAVAGG